jgi:glycerophosphoryl diester phosphodiesterase
MRTKLSETNSPALELLAGKRFLVIGHRGYSQLAPENTLPSFELALASGADLVELDFRQARDGSLVVIHDATLDRTTDAFHFWGKKQRRVETRTAEELRSLDAGGWFAPRFAGARIPLLTEALEVICRNSVALIERKAGTPGDCLELLRENHFINRVVVQSFDWEFLRLLHELEPRPVLGALGPPSLLPGGKKPWRISRKLNPAWMNHLSRTGASVAVWNRQLSRRAVHLAHERGLKVWVYTVNDTRQARRLRRAGVDGIITNRISLILKVHG